MLQRSLRHAGAGVAALGGDPCEVQSPLAGVIDRSVRTKFGLTFSPAEAQPIVDAAVKYKSVQSSFPVATMLSPYALAGKP